MSERFHLPLPGDFSRRDCAAQHFGHWCIEPKWFANALSAVRSGTLKPRADMPDDAPGGDHDDGSIDEEPMYRMVGNVAVIDIEGHMTKRGSSFGGCSTLETRIALRAAAKDWMVKAILLCISSPGGTVAGTEDLADDVLAVRQGRFGDPKRVEAFIDDMGCSAAYWVASQCASISANKTAIIGSIGTYVVLQDDTGAQEQMGIKCTVVSTGAFKGLGADGKVSEVLVGDVQREVDELNRVFVGAVAAGRGKKIADMAAVSDGRAWAGEQALQLGLIDEIASLDAAIQALSVSLERRATMSLDQFRAFAAEHPEAVATYIESGKKAGAAEARAAEVGRAKALREACDGDDGLALDLFLAGKDAEDAKIAVASIAKHKAAADAAKAQAAAEMAKVEAAHKAEVEKLRAEIGTQGPVGTSAAAKAAAEKAAEAPVGDDPKAQAKAQWDKMDASERSQWVSEAVFIRARAAQLQE